MALLCALLTSLLRLPLTGILFRRFVIRVALIFLRRLGLCWRGFFGQAEIAFKSFVKSQLFHFGFGQGLTQRMFQNIAIVKADCVENFRRIQRFGR